MKPDKQLATGMFKIGVYFIDILLVVTSIYLAFALKFNFNPPDFNYQPFVEISPLIVIVYLIFMYVFGLSDILKQSIGETTFSIFLTVLALLFATTFITFFARGFAYPRTVLLYSTILQFVFLVLWRALVWKIRRINHGIKDSLVIGEEAAENVTKKILIKQRDLYSIKYICSGKSENLDKYLNEVEVVFICNDVDLEIKSKIVDNCLADRKSVYIIPDIYEISLLNSKLSRADDIPMLKVKKLGLTFEQELIKRLLDIVVSAIGIVLASPIMLLSALIIKLTDGGNIFYKQERVTVNERRFYVLKFRTMVMNAEKLTGPVLAEKDDPRITKFGRFMRSTRIDELPQMFNVLLGDMSIVGPRPERPFFVEQFKKEISDYKYRTLVKAGVTGLAQVLGKYTTTAEDKVRYDIMYIKNYSILLDLKLILQTIKIMFMKESSSGVPDEILLSELVSDLELDIKVDR
ncbi:sugar transferase [Clostridium swellfunianum]|uniref:sugar transferase n=1 Tax=Clostridium swellfunianum TaxID=1367462 RepID=UPI002030D2FD|nr:sugar transferase [Clostridium swellfunianum]MCM0650582.1 sugar transferase [Clostridium swellfunianum]